MAADALEQFKIMLEHLRDNLDWSFFKKNLEALRNPARDIQALEDAFGRYLQAANIKDWWTRRSGGTFDDHMKFQSGSGFINLIEFAAQLANKQTLRAIKLPLSSSAADECYDISFWLAAVTRSIGHRNQQNPGMIVFWNRNPKKVSPCVLVSFGPGSPNSFRFLIASEAQDDSWRDLVMEDPEEPVSTLRPSPLDNPNASLRQLLDYIVKSDVNLDTGT
jgi:hypothetical protein